MLRAAVTPPAHVAPAVPNPAPIAAPPSDPNTVMLSTISMEYRGQHFVLAKPGVLCRLDAMEKPSSTCTATATHSIEVIDGALAPPPVPVSAPAAAPVVSHLH